MSDSIRDVTIRVSVEMANAKLPDIDASSVKSIADQIKQEIAGSIGSVQVPNVPIAVDRSSLDKVATDLKATLQQSVQDIQLGPIVADDLMRVIEDAKAKIADQMKMTVQIGMPGYAASVEQRASLSANTTLNAMGIPQGDMRDQIQSQMEKAAIPTIKRTDREEYNQQRSEERDRAKVQAEEDSLWQQRVKDAEQGVAEYSKNKAALEKAEDEAWSQRIKDAEQGVAEYSRNKSAAQKAEDADWNQRIREAEQGVAEWSKNKANEQKAEDAAWSARIRDAEQGVAEYSRHKADLDRAEDAAWSARIREAEQGVAEYSRNKKRREASENKDWQSRISDAESGIAEWSRIKKNQAAAEAEQAAESQRAYQNTIQLVKGIAQLAASAGSANPEIIKTIAAIEGMANMASAGVRMGGVVGGAAGAAVGGFAASLDWYRYARNINTANQDEEAANARAGAERYSGTVAQRYENAMSRTTRMPNLVDMERSQRSIYARGEEYRGIQRIDSDASLTPEQRERRREMLSQSIGSEDSFTGSQLRSRQLNKQLDTLMSTRPQDPNRDQNEILQRYDNTRNSLLKKFGSLSEQYDNKGSSGGSGAGLFMGLGQSTSNIVDRSQIGLEIEQTKKELIQNELDKRQQLQTLQENVTNSAEKEMSIRIELSKEAGKQHQILQEQQKTAHANVRREEEGIRSSALRFGMASPGDRRMAMNVEAKAQRILEQKRRKDAGENVEVDEFNMHDIAMAQQFGGKASMKVAQAQGLAKADQAGFEGFQFNKETLAEAQKQKESADEKMETFGPSLKEAAEKMNEGTRTMAEQLVSAMERAFDLRGLFEPLMEQLRNMEAEMKTYKALNGYTNR